VVLDKGFGAPIITNDGVTIAKEIELPDKYENIGVELVKQVALADRLLLIPKRALVSSIAPSESRLHRLNPGARIESVIPARLIRRA
jgi:hypothetical protein